MRVPPRRSDDADVIRARLRALLAEGAAPRGWLPDDEGGPGPVPDGPAAADAEEGSAPAGGGERGGPPGVALGRHRAPGTAVRLAPGRPGIRALAVAGLVAVLVLLLWTWWDRPGVTPAPAAPVSTQAGAAAATAARPTAGRVPTPGTPAVGEAAATAATVVVSVVGLVARPGLVTLPTGARVADAVTAAGGLVPPADPATVNLAAVLADGQQIAVGVPGAPGGGSGGAAAGSGGTANAGPVDLNAATAADLDGLPGIGPVLAQRIVDYRTQHGRFGSVDQLDDVPGIGPALYARLAGQVRV